MARPKVVKLDSARESFLHEVRRRKVSICSQIGTVALVINFRNTPGLETTRYRFNLVFNRIFQDAEAFKFHGNDVAFTQPSLWLLTSTRSRWTAGHDYIAWFERRVCADVGDEFRYTHEHLRRVDRLLQFTVKTC